MRTEREREREIERKRERESDREKDREKTKPIVAFCNFLKAPQKAMIYQVVCNSFFSMSLIAYIFPPINL